MTEPASAPADYVSRILTAADAYRVQEFDSLIAEARERLEPAVLVRDVFSPLLREVGDGWERGRYSVVQEHMVTSAVRRQLTYALDHHNRSATGQWLAFTTLSGERHEMGSLMLAVIAAARGCRVIYLGPDLPVAEIGRFCARVSVRVVAISIVTSPAVINAPAQLQELRAALPAGIGIWLGGQATRSLDRSTLPANTALVMDLDDFDRRLARLAVQEDAR